LIYIYVNTFWNPIKNVTILRAIMIKSGYLLRSSITVPYRILYYVSTPHIPKNRLRYGLVSMKKLSVIRLKNNLFVHISMTIIALTLS
jgi:hypothetical protein